MILYARRLLLHPARLQAKFLGLFCDLIGSLQYKLNSIFRTSDMPEGLFFEWLAATARLNATKSASLYFIRQQLSSSIELVISVKCVKSELIRELGVRG